MLSKIGLVFAGGGGKGAYQIGVWKALEELGIARQVEVVAGTSVGALNAALFAQGDYRRAEQAWLNMAPDDVLHLNFKKIKEHVETVVANTVLHQHQDTVAYLLKAGIFSRDGLTRMIERSLTQHALRDTALRCFANCTRLKLGFHSPFLPEYFPLHGKELPRVRQVLLASSAIPGVFGQEKIDEAHYWDGFLTDNLPIRPVYDTGCDVIFVVMLERDTWLNPKQFPNARLVPIAPREDPGHPLHFRSVTEKIAKGYDDGREALASAVGANALMERQRELMSRFLNEQRAFREHYQQLRQAQENYTTLAETGDQLSAALSQRMNRKD